MFRQFVFVIATTLLASCAPVAQYEKEVTELSAGFKKLKITFDALAEDERKAFIKSQRRLGLVKGNRIFIADTCNPNSAAVDCRPQIVDQDVQRPLRFNSAVQKSLKLTEAIAAYGDGLTTIVASKDIEELKSAVGKANAAIIKLQARVSPENAASFGPIANFSAWATGKLLDRIRFEQLRAIVEDGDVLIAGASKLLSEQAIRFRKSLIVQKGQVLVTDFKTLEHMRVALERMPDVAQANQKRTIDQVSEELVAEAVALQQFSEASVVEVFTKMRKAHAKLRHGLNNPEVPADVVFNEIGEFLDQVDTLKKGLEAAKEEK